MSQKLTILLFFAFLQLSFAQVGIGTTSPNPSSALEIKSTNSGLLIPRIELTSSTDTRTIPSPATSLMIYNTSTVSDITPGFYYWEGSWKALKSTTTPSSPSTTTSGWNLTGNTVASSDYLGTNNYFPLIFKVNNNQFSRFHPNGGLAIGNNAAANDNNSVAIGTSATATTSNQAVAIGPSSNAAGYQSVAIGLNSATSNNSTVAIGSSANASGYQSFAFGLSSASSNNNAFAIGNSANASGQQALALGQEANSSGQNATAIGYQATTSQANAIVLGSSSNANNKVGIGTNTPEERLHIVGSLKLVDGTQANNYVLTSDANGKASWKAPSTSTPTTTTSGWNLNGNTVTSADYLGTNNYFPLIFKVNNNQFSRFHPNGGLAIGNNAVAKDDNSIAIGTSANANTNNQAVAIGQSSNASGYQSVAIGLSASTGNNSALALGSSANASGYQSTSIGLSSAASSNNAIAIGNSSRASGEQAAAFGHEANSSAQNATAIGYQATTSQANAIVLGSSSNSNNKVGIGTNTPEERLHVVGSVKIVDGTQANNLVLTSDATGKASWKDVNNGKAFGEIFRNSNVALTTGAVNFGSTGVTSNTGLNASSITVNTTGIYRITYTIGLKKSSTITANTNAEFYLTAGGTEINGTRAFVTLSSGDSRSVTFTKLATVTAGQQISVVSVVADTNTSISANAASLMVELVK